MILTGTDTAVLKSRLHEYIERADEQHLAAIYVLLEQALNATSGYDDATLDMLYGRREAHLKGESRSYTVDEAFSHVRAQL